MPTTLVIQSHRTPLPADWLSPCLESVRHWTRTRGFKYRFLGDELFELIPNDIWDKTKAQKVVATDLARLLAMRDALKEGYERVVWCDADVLIHAPQRFDLPDAEYGLGREVWVQADGEGRKPRAYTKVHNAVMFYCAGNPFLEFYIDTAQRLLRLHQGRFVAQFIGPKLLSAIHNIAQCPVIETAGMLSPLVIKDLLAGGGPYLQLFRERSPQRPAAVNLCSSLTEAGEISDAEVAALVELLSENQELV